MKKLITLYIITVALGIALAFATPTQDKPKADSYTLTENERRNWAQFNQQEKSLSAALDQAIANAVNQPVGENSQRIHANLQQAWLSLDLVRSRRDSWLLKLQLDHDCKGCGIEADRLTRPPAK